MSKLLGCKNASQNLNLNDTEADSLEMSVTSETSIVTPALLKTMHISTELLQIKNAVQYAYNHRIGMEAGSDLNGQLANYGINSIEAQSKTLATMVAVQKIIESGARYNSKQLIRAFTKSEKALVGGELKTVTAKDMGFLDLGYPKDKDGTELSEGINAITIIDTVAKMKMRFCNTFSAVVDVDGETKVMDFNAIILMTQQELSDLLKESVNTNAAGTAVGNIQYLVFRGLADSTVDGSGLGTASNIAGCTIFGCLVLILSNLYTSPELTALDVDSEQRAISGDNDHVEIDRKIIFFNPTALTLWRNFPQIGVDKVVGDQVNFIANNSVRTAISKSRRNGALIVKVKRKIANPALASTLATSKKVGGKRTVIAQESQPGDFDKGGSKQMKAMTSDTINYIDKETGEKIGSQQLRASRLSSPICEINSATCAFSPDTTISHLI
jgi:hypothetical protein